MDPDIITAFQNMLEGKAQQYTWLFLAAATALFFKSAIENFVSGLIYFYGNDYNVDDVVFIRGAKKARIVRQTWTKTVFYLMDTDPRRRLVVTNRYLSSMGIEKVLPIEPRKLENNK